MLDPNIDAVCDDAIFKNATAGFKKLGVTLAWYGRPRMMIMQDEDPTKPATVECPSKTVKKGHGVMCDLLNASDPCTQAQYAIVDRLVELGIGGFYWDEYQAVRGRMTFTQAVLKKYPHLAILGEQGVDIDSLQVFGLPWMAMPPGVWDPPFEPVNSVLQKIFSPLSTTVVGTYGADQNYNHTIFSLNSSKGTSLMMLAGTENISGVCPPCPPHTDVARMASPGNDAAAMDGPFPGDAMGANRCTNHPDGTPLCKNVGGGGSIRRSLVTLTEMMALCAADAHCVAFSADSNGFFPRSNLTKIAGNYQGWQYWIQHGYPLPPSPTPPHHPPGPPPPHHPPGPPPPKPPPKVPCNWCRQLPQHKAHCEQMRVSADNAAWRWTQYGKARGCPKPLPFDAAAMNCQ